MIDELKRLLFNGPTALTCEACGFRALIVVDTYTLSSPGLGKEVEDRGIYRREVLCRRCNGLAMRGKLVRRCNGLALAAQPPAYR